MAKMNSHPNFTAAVVNHDDQCLQTRRWYVFLLSSLITFAAGFVPLVLWNIGNWVWKTCFREPRRVQPKGTIETGEDSVGWMTEAKDWAGELLSGQRKVGRVMVSIQQTQESNFIFSLLVLLIYCREFGVYCNKGFCLPA